MKQRVYLGIDLGTQSVRVLAAMENGALAAARTEPLASIRDGVRHEQSPELWWRATVLCCRAVMAELGSDSEIAGLAVDATSGTIVLLDGQLRALTPGLMYDDGRAHEEALLVNTAGNALWDELSYRMQASWALPKLLWLKRQNAIPRGASLAHQNDFINARLAGHPLAADSSNSLKSGYDLLRGRWPAEVFDQLGIDTDLFPEVVAPGQLIGHVCAKAAEETGLPHNTPIFTGMTDGCAAQIASGATTPGSWNSVIGTTLVLKGVTSQLLRDPSGIVYSHRSADNLWLPGGASSTGAGAIASRFAGADLDALNDAALRADASPLLVYPLTGQGERFPFSAPEACGFSLRRATSSLEEFLSILQGIAFVERLAFDALHRIGAPINGPLTISGGAAKSEALSQIRADVLGRELLIPRITEGAFGMAMLVAAHFSTLADVTARMVHIARTISPQKRFEVYAGQYRDLVHELTARRWLPQDLADITLARVNL